MLGKWSVSSQHKEEHKAPNELHLPQLAAGKPQVAYSKLFIERTWDIRFGLEQLNMH